MSSCSITGCGREVFARGWCQPHWGRWRRHGNPQVGRVRPGYLVELFAAAIKSEQDGCIVWPASALNKYGYAMVTWEGKYQRANRLMCQLAHGDPFKAAQAAHSCGNRACINPRHLRWATNSENQMDRVMHGTHSRGERNATSKVSQADAIAIRAAWANREGNQKEIGARFGITQSAVSSIVTGKNWGWLNEQPA